MKKFQSSSNTYIRVGIDFNVSRDVLVLQLSAHISQKQLTFLNSS